MEGITINEILMATDGSLLCGDRSVSIKHLSIDSKGMQGDDLFVPLIGEKVDAHQFIEQAFLNGAVAVLTSRHQRMEDHRPWIFVEDTKKALQQIGAFYRMKHPISLVGITGSVGKTTTRELVAAALMAKFRVYKTKGNKNSQVGVPITLSEISKEDEVGVIELGMSEPSELTAIAKLASIQMGVITNIGVAHIEQLGSMERIRDEKLTIQDGMMAGGILFLNGDDPMLQDTTGKDGVTVIYYGTQEGCDYRAVEIHLEGGYPCFKAIYKEEETLVRLNVMGHHNILNAMAALAVASQYGIAMKDAAKSLEHFKGFQGRQQILRENGIVYLDDTYNASPDSMKAGIDVLRSMEGVTRKIAVLADMKELGERERSFHYEIGIYLSRHPVDVVFTLGPLSREIAKGVKENQGCMDVHSFDEKEGLIVSLKEILLPGDAVLLKGSNGMQLSRVLEQLLEENE